MDQFRHIDERISSDKEIVKGNAVSSPFSLKERSFIRERIRQRLSEAAAWLPKEKDKAASAKKVQKEGE